MSRITKPTDAELIAAVKRTGYATVRDVCNTLRYGDGYDRKEFAWVGRRLKMLADRGKLVRVVCREYDPQPDPYGQGLFGGAGSCIRHRARYSLPED